MNSIGDQIKQVVRRLARAPMFTFAALLTLALGIGSNVAIFSVLEGVLLKPLPYPNADRLVGIWHTAPGIGLKDLNIDASIYFIYKEQGRTFEDLGVYTGDRVSVTGKAEPEQVKSLLVTYGLLPTLGVKPVIGRNFTPQDDSPGTPETVILSYGYWQRHFSGDPGVLGKRMVIDGAAKEVIGVMGRDFRFLDMDVELMQPFRFDRAKTMLGNFSYEAVGRLRPGVSMAQAQADAQRLMPVVNRSFPAPPGFSPDLFEKAGIAPAFHPFKQDLTGDIGRMLWVLMGTIGVVLLIACANVANLLLVRVEARHLELTIRAALGASAGRIAFELLFESLLVALLGGLGGLILADGALALLIRFGPASIPRLAQIGINGTVFCFAIAVSIATGLLFGAVPVLKYASAQLGTALRDGGRALSVSRERHRARNLLVVTQVALALVLLISSGLMIRTFRALIRVEPGFTDAANLQTLSISIPDAQVAELDKVYRTEQEIQRQLESIQGVKRVAITTAVPMDNHMSSDVLFIRDHHYRDGELPPIRRFIFTTPGLPGTLGTRLLAGRDIEWDDLEKKTQVAMVSEQMARENWGSAQAALHKQMREGMKDEWREVIGVVADVHQDGVDRAAPTTVYYPLRMSDFQGDHDVMKRNVSYVIRTPRAGTQAFLNEVRQKIWAVDPNLPLAEVRTVDEMYRKSMARTSFTLVLLTIAAGMALILGSIGIYGVIAYSIAQRTREIGIRMALGAERGRVAGMFVKHGVTLACVGGVIGLVASFAVMRLMSSLLFSVSPVDGLTYGTMLGVLLVVALAASYLPARKAASMDAGTALRSE